MLAELKEAKISKILDVGALIFSSSAIIASKGSDIADWSYEKYLELSGFFQGIVENVEDFSKKLNQYINEGYKNAEDWVDNLAKKLKIKFKK